MVSKSQIDRLGERLKAGQFSEEDLRELDAYRLAFAESYEAVMAAIRQELELTPTGRSAKSTTAIVDKLRRESIRLSQMQDIAGCRIVVGTIRDQQNVVSRLSWLFPQHELIDRRRTPSHGYRAVHLVVWIADRPVEVQIHTTLQNLWAGLSERLSDRLGIELKYGGGDPNFRSTLDGLSETIREFEALDSKIIDHEHLREVADLQGDLTVFHAQLVEMLQRADRLFSNEP